MNCPDSPAAAGQKSLQQIRAENRAVKKFNAELQKAVDGVDWDKHRTLKPYSLGCVAILALSRRSDILRGNRLRLALQ
jgi:hypothetical protein